MTVSDFPLRIAITRLLTAVLPLLAAITTSTHIFAIQLPEQSFSISHHQYDDGDLSLGGPLLMLRKTLSPEVLSLKFKYQAFTLEESAQDQITNAPAYSETQDNIGLGFDYLYFDSAVSFSTNYGSQDSATSLDINMDIAQELRNAKRTLLLGYSHQWNDDSDLSMHNKIQQIRLGYKTIHSPRWAMLYNFDFASSAGDLENFLSARRFQAADRTNLPDSRTERTITLTSLNDLERNNSLRSSIAFSKNDWGQDAKTLQLIYTKKSSQTFSMKYHARYVSRNASKHYIDSVVAPAQDFYSDDRGMASQTFKEAGLAGEWKFRQRQKRRIDDLTLDLGYSMIKSDYDKTPKVSNSGNLIFLNLSGTY